MDTKNKIFVVIGSAALIAAAGYGAVTLLSGGDRPSYVATNSVSTTNSSIASNTQTTNTTATTSSGDSSTATSYKDGTYTASSSYNVPHGGQNSIKATITISGGKITAASATNSYTDRESAMYIDSFNSYVNSDATGQSLAGYSPSRIGGASLTTYAFSNAIDTIRAQAKA
ncbi:MAG: hypothetical protein WAW62_03760 [Candidatus Saccharimonas aalborgensis]